jgi:hypothetical protein
MEILEIFVAENNPNTYDDFRFDISIVFPDRSHMVAGGVMVGITNNLRQINIPPFVL